MILFLVLASPLGIVALAWVCAVLGMRPEQFAGAVILALMACVPLGLVVALAKAVM